MIIKIKCVITSTLLLLLGMIVLPLMFLLAILTGGHEMRRGKNETDKT